MPNTQIMIGSDPEFALKRKGERRATRAARVIDGTTRDKIGVDGCPDVGELRPDPAYTVDEHIQNIEELIIELLETYPDYYFYGGSSHSGYPIGGHIHFSGGEFGRVTSSSHVVKCLDAFLAVPVMMLEGPRAARSRRLYYGRLSDVRRQPHGGIEYRTLPSWIISKKIAKAVLDIAYLIATCYEEIPETAVEEVGVHSWYGSGAFYDCNKEYFRPKMDYIFSILRGLTGAQDVMDSINYLEETIREDGDWHQGYTLNVRWELHRRRDFHRTSAARHRYPDRAQRQRAQVVSRVVSIRGTPGDYLTGDIATAVMVRLPPNRRYRYDYVLYGLRDRHGIDIAVSEEMGFLGADSVIAAVERFIPEVRRDFDLRVNTNFGPIPQEQTVRIGISYRLRLYGYRSVAAVVAAVIRALEGIE